MAGREERRRRQESHTRFLVHPARRLFMASSRRYVLNAQWFHYISAGTIAVAFLTGLLRFLLLDWADRNHCHSLINEGRWLDRQFKNWQPEGCMLHRYGEKDAGACLSNRRVIFMGDSTVRQLFFTFAHLVDPTLASTHPDDGSKHSDYALQSKSRGISLDFIWDPYLNDSRSDDILSTPPAFKHQKPALLVIGTGLWYLRYPESGGLPAWESQVDQTFSLLGRSMPELADEVVFIPVEVPIEDKLSPERRKTILTSEIQAMNSDLIHRVRGPSSWTWSARPAHSSPHSPRPPPSIVVPLVFNEMLAISQTDDGLHFSNAVLVAQVNILLNHHCNKKIPKVYPFDKTCCRPYPTPPSLQLVLLLCISLWGVIAKLAVPKLANRPRVSAFFPSGDNILPLAIFGFAIGLSFLGDRTGLWHKEQKQFELWTFVGFSLASLVGGLMTMKTPEEDLGFLNREQTDEWKGWMQIAILIYHYYGASQISGIYNPIRVLVASYLFMTGYGHFTYYYKKADYSFDRIVQVLVRLNLLTIALAYTMNTDYMFYYFAPLVSFWFLVIYVTMIIGYPYNDRTGLLITKLLVSAGFLTWLTHDPWITNNLFAFLQIVFNIQWSARETLFRVNLDLWIVYAGALTALAVTKCRELRWTSHRLWPAVYRTSIVLSFLTLFWFFWFELTRENKFIYNAYHPYVSFLPIGAFIILRNATPALRSTSSRMFSFIGRCSLETFILQYHLWLAGDSKGILLVIPGTRWRPVNRFISTFMFIYLSHKVATATAHLTAWICGPSEKSTSSQPPTLPMQHVKSGGRGGGGNGVDSQGQEVPKEILFPPSLGENAPPDGRVGRLVIGVQEWRTDARARIGAALIFFWVLNMLWPAPK